MCIAFKSYIGIFPNVNILNVAVKLGVVMFGCLHSARGQLL